MPLSFLTMTLALAFMWFLCAPRTLLPDTCQIPKHTLPASTSLHIFRWPGLPADVQMDVMLMHTIHNSLYIVLIRYPEKFDYTRTLSKSMFYYEANMLGTLPPGWVLLHVQAPSV